VVNVSSLFKKFETHRFSQIRRPSEDLSSTDNNSLAQLFQSHFVDTISGNNFGKYGWHTDCLLICRRRWLRLLSDFCTFPLKCLSGDERSLQITTKLYLMDSPSFFGQGMLKVENKISRDVVCSCPFFIFSEFGELRFFSIKKKESGCCELFLFSEMELSI